MAGHNKWAQIKHKKAATDAKKSKVFGKIARLISVEAKRAKGDVNAPGLRLAIQKAKEANMPGDNIERAIRKASEDSGAGMEEVVYEAYGPGGVALLIVGLTDSKNRTAAEIKHLLSLYGVALASPGSASWAFEKTSEGFAPTMTTSISQEDGEALLALVDALEEHDDVQTVYTNAE